MQGKKDKKKKSPKCSRIRGDELAIIIIKGKKEFEKVG